MKSLKVGIIGAGNIATTAHIPCYKVIPGVEIVGICDRNLHNAQIIASRYNIPYAFGDYREMFEGLHLDVVSICVPNKFHHSCTLAALDAGCNVLCEKPPALTVAESEEMELIARRNHCLLSYDFQTRFSREFLDLKRTLGKGDFGYISHGKAIWLRQRGIPGWGCFTDKAMQGGGPLIDIGSHILDAALNLLDYPDISYICASWDDHIGKKGGIGNLGSWEGTSYTVEDSLFGFIGFKDGTSLEIDTSYALNMREKEQKNILLYGERLGASLFPLEYYDGNKTHLVKFNGEDNPRQRLMDNFCAACRGEQELNITARQGIYVQKVIALLYKSAQGKCPVCL